MKQTGEQKSIQRNRFLPLGFMISSMSTMKEGKGLFSNSNSEYEGPGWRFKQLLITTGNTTNLSRNSERSYFSKYYTNYSLIIGDISYPTTSHFIISEYCISSYCLSPTTSAYILHFCSSVQLRVKSKLLTTLQVQQSKTSYCESVACHFLSAPTKSTHCRCPGHQQMEFLSSSERNDR